MKVGIVVFSQTGHTPSVAQRLADALAAGGHEATVAQVETVEAKPNAPAPTQIKTAPDVAPYDAVFFAGPVQAFGLARVMGLYLSGISDLTGKKVSCFVTQQFKKPWLGGNHAIKKMRAACRAKGAVVEKSAIVHWSSADRESQIADLVKRLSAL